MALKKMGPRIRNHCRLMLLAWCFVVAGIFCRAQAVKDLPQPTNYVSDFAHVLSPATVEQLDRLCGQVDHEAHAQIAVVTVKTTNGEPIAMYAVDLWNAWKIGPKSSDRGLLILLAIQDHQRWIATGYGLEGILPDALVGQIGRQMLPLLQKSDYDGALTLAVDKTSQIIAQNAGVKLTPLTATQLRAAEPPHRATLGQTLLAFLFIVIVIVILIWASSTGLLGFLLGMFFGGWWGGGGGGFGGGGSGGGDSGGSGFGGFDGGSTGGGGAGGSW